MKIKNNSRTRFMIPDKNASIGFKFVNPGETVDVNYALAKVLIESYKVEEYVSPSEAKVKEEEAKNLISAKDKEIAELKKQLSSTKKAKVKEE